MWGKGKQAGAIEAAADDGREGLRRGRSVFKRSANAVVRHHVHYDRSSKRDRCSRFHLSRAGWAEVEESLDDLTSYSEEEIVEPCSEALDICVELPDHGLPLPGENVLSDEEFCMGYETCSTCSSTTVPSEEDVVKAAPTKAKQDMSTSCLTPWEMAVLRAQEVAELFGCHSSGPLRMRNKRPGRDLKQPRAREVLAKTLLKQFGAKFEDDGVLMHDNLFTQFRWQFLKQHGANFCESLRTCFESRCFNLRPTPLAVSVGQRFMRACQDLEGNLCPAFHGTAEGNLPGICEEGFVIPGRGNKVRVANGSAHGLGIYTAVASNPRLSLNYTRGSRKLLVCGVLDSSDTQQVKHAGDQMVIFDACRVAPLFEASEVPVPLHSVRLLGGPDSAAQNRRAAKERRKPAGRLTGIVAFLARRAARKRRGRFDFRNSFDLQKSH